MDIVLSGSKTSAQFSYRRWLDDTGFLFFSLHIDIGSQRRKSFILNGQAGVFDFQWMKKCSWVYTIFDLCSTSSKTDRRWSVARVISGSSWSKPHSLLLFSSFRIRSSATRPWESSSTFNTSLLLAIQGPARIRLLDIDLDIWVGLQQGSNENHLQVLFEVLFHLMSLFLPIPPFLLGHLTLSYAPF